MNKHLQISLFLARAMGLSGVYVSPHNGHIQYQPSAYAGYTTFDPHTDKAQWAEVVLLAVRQGVNVDIYEDEVFAADAEMIRRRYKEATDESRMAATLEAIALALGWKEE